MVTKRYVSLGVVLFGLFGLSFLISKSAFTLFYALAVIFGLYQFDWKNFFKLSTLELVMISLYPVAILLNLFSVGGFESGSLNILQKWTWPLIYFPVVYLQKHKAERLIFFKALAVSLFIACLYSLFIFVYQFNLVYDENTRIASFWDISRWGYFCSMAIIVLFSLLLEKNLLSPQNWKKALVLFFLSSFCLIINNSRAPAFAVLLGILLLLVMYRKSFKFYLGYFIVVALIASSSEGVRDRILSSFAVQKQDGQIVSEHKSNAARLNMWKVTLDLYQQVPIFGVGFDNSRPVLENFLQQKDSEYVSRYTSTQYSYIDQHSSYLTVLLQFGGLFCIYLYAFLFMVIIKARRDKIYMPALLCTSFIYTVYTGVVSFEAVVFFGLISFLITYKKASSVKV